MFSYIARQWRGEFSLPRSYWVNGVLIGLPFNIYFRAVAAMSDGEVSQSPTSYLYMVFIPLLFVMPLVVWQIVGIWRSAGNRIAQGQVVWAWIARLLMLSSAASLLITVFANGRIAYSLMEASFDERAAYFEVHGRGKTVVFRGEITDASARQIETLLNAPGYERLVINGSNGGFVQPGLRLMKLIHERHLFVVALGECASTCTGLIAAGETRAIAPDTVVGFHRGAMAGTTDPAEGWADVETYYRNAGVSDVFIEKTRQHVGPTDLYEPTIREMIENHFLTDIFVDGDNLYIPARQWCDRKPEQCDRTGRQNRLAPIPTKERS